jgi:plasmid stabilization system protein ParE
MSNAKRDVESLLNRLPDNVSVEDIQYHLYVLDKVRRGLEDARVKRHFVAGGRREPFQQMAHRIVWSKRAAQDLDSITDYIAADSPAYASVVLKSIVNQTRMLARFPQAGRKVPEVDDENIRELIGKRVLQ